MHMPLSIYNETGAAGGGPAGMAQRRRPAMSASSTLPSRAPVPSSGARRERAVPAVTRAAAILRVLAESETPVGVQAIARALGLVPSTCLHILRALVAEEMVSFDPETKRYGLGLGLLSLARSLLKQGGFGATIQPALEALSRDLGVTAIGLQVHGLDHVVVTAISRAHEPFHIHVEIGSRFPALISASGRALAASGEHSRTELRKRFAGIRWDRAPSFEEWLAEVELTRQAGYGVDVDRYILGVTVVSTPIRRDERVTHMLVVVGLTERLRTRIDEIGREIVRIAGKIERELDD